jgi:phosphate transport system ATP-binding protein
MIPLSSLELKNVTVEYGDSVVLRGLSFSAPAGLITAIVGPSGCGKTTTLKCLNLLVLEEGARFSGRLLLGGRPVRQGEADRLRERVGMVFQTPTPFPLSIRENMAYPLRYYGMRDRVKRQAVIEEKLGLAGLSDEIDDMDRPADTLSGGQQQRLCIARALTVEPEALLLDEPCSALDLGNTARIERLLMGLRGKYTIVIVTHNLAQAKRIADKTVFMLNGNVVEEGPTESLFSSPEKRATEEYLAGAFG